MTERTCNGCNVPLIGGQKKYCSHNCANRASSRSRASINHASPWPTCRVEDCQKPARSRKAELCPMHYHRVYRYGTLERTRALVERGERRPPQVRTDLTGVRYGTLVVVRAQADRWICQCDCGELRSTRIGDLNRTGQANTCGVPGKHLSEDVEYTAVHDRVRRLHGSARDHHCVDCGKPALHWSYDHLDPDERISQAERTAGIAYSLKTEHYQARCVPCHKRYDLDRINATRLAA